MRKKNHGKGKLGICAVYWFWLCSYATLLLQIATLFAAFIFSEINQFFSNFALLVVGSNVLVLVHAIVKSQFSSLGEQDNISSTGIIYHQSSWRFGAGAVRTVRIWTGLILFSWISLKLLIAAFRGSVPRLFHKCRSFTKRFSLLHSAFVFRNLHRDHSCVSVVGFGRKIKFQVPESLIGGMQENEAMLQPEAVEAKQQADDHLEEKPPSRQAEASITDGDWKCEACTVINNSSFLICGVCEAPRMLASMTDGDWKCEACTVINNASLLMCGVCEAPRMRVDEEVMLPPEPVEAKQQPDDHFEDKTSSTQAEVDEEAMLTPGAVEAKQPYDNLEEKTSSTQAEVDEEVMLTPGAVEAKQQPDDGLEEKPASTQAEVDEEAMLTPGAAEAKEQPDDHLEEKTYSTQAEVDEAAMLTPGAVEAKQQPDDHSEEKSSPTQAEVDEEAMLTPGAVEAKQQADDHLEEKPSSTQAEAMEKTRLIQVNITRPAQLGLILEEKDQSVIIKDINTLTSSQEVQQTLQAADKIISINGCIIKSLVDAKEKFGEVMPGCSLGLVIERPDASRTPQASRIDGDWKCEACTVINNSSLLMCGVCETPRLLGSVEAKQQSDVHFEEKPSSTQAEPLTEEQQVANVLISRGEKWAHVARELQATNRITKLSWNSKGLEGPIPPQLGQLTNLKHLNLSSNLLSGPIPPQLGQLTSLTYLNLSSNGLSGPIPQQLGQLTNLTTLFLSSNKLSGQIPPQLGQLTNLTDLSLSTNQLRGPIPPQLGKLTKLTFLNLYSNQLSGMVPLGLVKILCCKNKDFSDNPDLRTCTIL